MSKAAEDAAGWAAFQSRLGMAGFVAVLLSLIFTGWAAWAAATSAKIASDAITQLERPWLTIQLHPRFGGDPDEDGTIHTLFDIANHGRMPAIIVRCVGEINAAKEHPGRPKMLDQSSGVVGPGEKLSERKVFCPFFWKYDSLVSLSDGESYFLPQKRAGAEVFLYLIITYRGLTDRTERTSSYCWRYDHDSYQWAEFGGGDYNRHT